MFSHPILAGGSGAWATISNQLKGYRETGDDELSGNQDDDTLLGGDGMDSIFAQFGDDFADRGAGDDLIFGGQDDGDDTLIGGAGTDTLFGGAGAYVFVFAAGAEVDIIQDFDVGSDILDLSGLGAAFDSFADIIAAGAQQGSSAVFTFAEDQLTLRNTDLVSLTQDDVLFG